MLILRLAWRNLFRNIRRTVLTCLLIASSLLTIILMDGVMLGMIDVMIGSLTHTLEGEAQINSRGFRDDFEPSIRINNYREIQNELVHDPVVRGASARIIVGAMIASSYNSAGALVYGVDAASEKDVSKIEEAVYAGHFLSGQEREILLGRPMAELLEVELGDRLVLTSSTADSKEIVQELFRLSGLFEFGPESLDENLIFINLHKAQSLFELPGAAHQIAIRFNRPEMANDPTLNIYKSFNNDQTEANGWLALQPTMGAMLEMTGYSTLIVGGILFLLASLGIINSMFMSIYERIYEFGVIKSVGTRPAEIIKLILTEAFFLALISCFFGIILGYFISSYFSTNGIPMGRMEMSGIVLDGNMNTILEPYQFINFPIYVTLLTLIAAIYPALFASKIVPTEALQKAL